MISTNSFALCALLLAGIAGLALRSSPVEADSVSVKPLGFAADMPSKDVITNAIPRAESVPSVSAELRAGLDALSNHDAVAAIAARDRLPSTSLDRHILT